MLFVNHRARLYGVDSTGSYTLANTEAGNFRLTGAAGFERGQDRSTHTNLYHIMPPNGTIAIEHRLGPWSSALECRAVTRKRHVDDTRLEPQTPGYTTFNLRSAFESGTMRLDLAVTNLLDRQFENPLGGAWQSALYPRGYNGATFRPLPAQGRSVDAGITVKFGLETT